MIALAGQGLAISQEMILRSPPAIILSGTEVERAQQIVRFAEQGVSVVPGLVEWMRTARYEKIEKDAATNEFYGVWDDSTRLANAATIALCLTEAPVLPELSRAVGQLEGDKLDVRGDQFLARVRYILRLRRDTKDRPFVDLLTLHSQVGRQAGVDYFAAKSDVIGIAQALKPWYRDPEIANIFRRYAKEFRPIEQLWLRHENDADAAWFFASQLNDAEALLNLWVPTHNPEFDDARAQRLGRAKYTPETFLRLFRVGLTDPSLRKAFPINFIGYPSPPEILLEIDRGIDADHEAAIIQGCFMPITDQVSLALVRKAFRRAKGRVFEARFRAAGELANSRLTDAKTRREAEDKLLMAFGLETIWSKLQFSLSWAIGQRMQASPAFRQRMETRLIELVKTSEPYRSLWNLENLIRYRMDVRKLESYYEPFLNDPATEDKWSFYSEYIKEDIPYFARIFKTVPATRTDSPVYSLLLNTGYRSEILHRMLLSPHGQTRFTAAMYLAQDGDCSPEVEDTILTFSPKAEYLAPNTCPKPGGIRAYRCLLALFFRRNTPEVVAALGSYIQADQWDENAFLLMKRCLVSPDRRLATAAAKALEKVNPLAQGRIAKHLLEMLDSPRPANVEDFYRPIIAVLASCADQPGVRMRLQQLLSDHDAEKRFWSMVELANRNQLSESDLLARLDDSNFDIRREAARLAAPLAISGQMMPPKFSRTFEEANDLDLVRPIDNDIRSLSRTGLSRF